MGFVFSKFRAKKNRIEMLEELDYEIRSIEESQKVSEEQQRKIINKMVTYPAAGYLITLIGYYYLYSSPNGRLNMRYVIPFAIFPFLIYYTKFFFVWWYKRSLFQNIKTVSRLKEKKKTLLNEIMETETYKKAKEILEIYGYDLVKEPYLDKLRNEKSIAPFPAPSPVHYSPVRSLPNASVHRQISLPANVRSTEVPGNKALAIQQPLTVPRLPLPRPILRQERGAFERLLDVVLGDGPNNRYALICKTCGSHNGMALENEFHYIAYRCAYCQQWNPARKQKPSSPQFQGNENDALLPAQEEDDDDTSEAERISNPCSSDEEGESSSDQNKDSERNEETFENQPLQSAIKKSDSDFEIIQKNEIKPPSEEEVPALNADNNEKIKFENEVDSEHNSRFVNSLRCGDDLSDYQTKMDVDDEENSHLKMETNV